MTYQRAINEELADLRGKWNQAEMRVKELEEALRDIARIAGKPSVPKRTIKMRAEAAMSAKSSRDEKEKG